MGSLGASKGVVDNSVRYSNERKQFGTEISNFGAIKYKLAQQAIGIFAGESATYRASQNIDDAINMYKANGMSKYEAYLEGIRQYAIEAAILKVGCSEALDYVVDEGVQIYGGMGYSAESPVERAYRDSRINRIFEGTNEINRLLIVDMVMKRAMAGELNLMKPAKAVADEILEIPDFGTGTESYYEEKHKYITNFKKAILLTAGAAAMKFMAKLGNQQEIIMNISDMAIETYFAESVLLRVEKMEQRKGEEAVKLLKDIVDVYLYDAADKINKYGRDAINSFAEHNTDEHTGMLMGMKRFTKVAPVNVVEKRRRIANKMIEENKYCF